MNGTVFMLTLRQIVGQKRIRVAAVAAVLLPLGLALLYATGDLDDSAQDWTANALLGTLMITLIVPLACLLVGESAMGTEIEDGTAVYILSKPVPRAEIITAKAGAAIVVTMGVLLPVMLLAPMVSLNGEADQGIIAGFAVAGILGICAYTVLFVWLSVAIERPLLAGIGYVFIWEGALGDLFEGTRYLSIRQYCLGIADAIATVDPNDFEAELGGLPSFLLILLVIAGGTLLAARSLSRFEVSGED
jgi:ABC-2 type transport system permease protein